MNSEVLFADIDKYDAFADSSKRDEFEAMYYKLPVIKKLTLTLKTIINFQHRELTAIDAYYEQISVIHTVRRLRSGIKLTLFHTLMGLFEAIILSEKFSGSHLVALISAIAIFYVFYLYTMRVNSAFACNRISVVLMMGNLMLFLVTAADKTLTLKPMYIPGFILIISFFTLLPIKLDIALAILFLYIVGYALFDFLSIYCQWDQHDRPSEEDYGTSIFGRNYFVIQIILWLTAILDGIQLYAWNLLRQRSALMYLAQRIRKLEICIEQTVYQKEIWNHLIPKTIICENYAPLESLLPPISAQYEVIREHSRISLIRLQVAGMNDILCNCNLAEKVDLLNLIFYQLDKLCEQNKCDKISCFNNAYLAVAGLHQPAAEHFLYTIDFGLAACHVFKRLRKTYGEVLSITVAIHTGAVLSTIVGCLKPRLDVFSNDVDILEQLQASGLPGRVRVSWVIYQACQSQLRFASGEPLASDPANPTYYVDPRSRDRELYHQLYTDLSEVNRTVANLVNFFTDDSNEFKNNTVARPSKTPKRTKFTSRAFPSITSRRKAVKDVDMDSKHTVSITSLMKESERVKNALHNLVASVHMAPRSLREQYSRLPIRYWSLFFVDQTAEWHYRNQSGSRIGRGVFDSDGLSFVADVVMLTTHNSIIAILTYLMFYETRIHSTNLLILCILEVVFLIASVIFILRIVLSPVVKTKNPTLRLFFRVLNSSTSFEVIIFMLAIMPTIHHVLCVLVFSKNTNAHEEKDYVVSHRTFFTMESIVCVANILPSASLYPMRLFGSLVSVVIVVSVDSYIFQISRFDEDTKLLDSFVHERYLVIIWLNMIVAIFVFWILSRENDNTSRVCFHHRREWSIQCEATQLAVQRTRALLYNIVPQPIFSLLSARPDKSSVGAQLVDYWQDIPTAGLAVIKVSNFYQQHWSADNTGNIQSVELLNSLICSLDRLLESDDMFEVVEKLRANNDGYFLLSGLHSAVNRIQNHWVPLIEYCLQVLILLSDFNSRNYSSKPGFELTIGCHVGAVVAGLAGVAKLGYEAWGHAVSRTIQLCEIGIVNEVVTDETVYNLMHTMYEFERESSTAGLESVYVCKAKLISTSPEFPRSVSGDP